MDHMATIATCSSISTFQITILHHPFTFIFNDSTMYYGSSFMPFSLGNFIQVLGENVLNGSLFKQNNANHCGTV